MGLISRVSSRTYRKSYFIKMGNSSRNKKSTTRKPNALKSLTKIKKSGIKPGGKPAGKSAGKPGQNKKQFSEPKGRNNAVEKARKQYLADKSVKDQNREKKNKEREAALARAEKRREEKAKLNKALGQRSKKGQPMMNVRMSHLLEKIESNPDRYGSSSMK